MNTVNRLGDRQWNKARSKILPCADWVKLDMLRRALKLHEGKLSLRHRSADQSPFGHSIGPTISKRTRDSPGQIVITVISSLRSALCSLIHAQRNCMFWRFIWPLERFTFGPKNARLVHDFYELYDLTRVGGLPRLREQYASSRFVSVFCP